MNIATTAHAVIRCGERGFRETDFDLIAEYGTMTNEGFLLTRKDIMKAERAAKILVHRLSKLQDSFVATTDDGGAAKTIFRVTRKQRRRQTGRWQSGLFALLVSTAVLFVSFAAGG
ncbi:MAG: hypothetical protein OXF74_10965 [Rhodobacteraceae bacterium]|nr:hypothetical protein [Paracoccaceae bacterium]